MKWILIIILIPIFGYVVLISCAGLGVLIAEWRFKNSPYREDILRLIGDTWAKIRIMPTNEIALLERNGLRECVSHASQDYSVDVVAKKMDGGYSIMISAGILKPITFGHTETYWLSDDADA
ncbi:MAG: hypothetical protein JJT96_10030 [Opitutales bacterium]|nr:hypothetical protein [Opitutales bacterium]